MKNESARKDTERMKMAINAIAKHFEMEGENKCDILAKLIDEGELSLLSEPRARSPKS